MHTSTKLPTNTLLKKEKADDKKTRLNELRRIRTALKDKIDERGIDIAMFFKKFDKNGDGVFSPLEFECAFVALDIDVAKADLRRFIALTDTNKDGRVDFNEFYTMLKASDDEIDQSDMDRAGICNESEVDFEASFEKFE